MAADAALPEIRYNRDIRPVLSDNCFLCHGPDKNHRKAKLRLDERDNAIAKGAIVPGKPDESELVRRLYTTNADDVMPPPDTHKTVTAAQKELFKQWIAQGAKFEPHWAFITPTRPDAPKVSDKKWVRNPVDAFIVAQLDAKKITPSAEAGRRTLLRRLSLDLTGLPPTPEEVAAFENDRSRNAYEKQVERLLASPHYGERMAVPWLDVVRFADTVGYHGDQNANVFPYRDYVIESFNRNKPFDQFTTEQLAGDLLSNNTAEQRVATGFNRLNMMTREGGAQPKEYLAKYGADRVRTVGMAWLGISVGCAECHDHKFDPFTMRDFYAMKSYFADVRQWGVYSDYKYTPNPDLKGWDNDHPFPPEETVESPYLHRRAEKLRAQMNAIAASVPGDKQPAAFDTWAKSVKAMLKQSPDGWLAGTPLVAVTTNTTVTTNKVAAKKGAAEKAATNLVTLKTNVAVVTNFTALADGSMWFEPKAKENPPLRVRLPAGTVAALRLELIPDARHGGSIFRAGTKSANLKLSASLKRSNEKKETKLAFYHSEADAKEARFSNGFEVIGIKDSWRVARDRATNVQSGVWLLDPPVQVAEGDTLSVTLNTNMLGRLRVSVSPLASLELTGARGRESRFNQKTPASSPSKLDWLAGTAPDTNAFAAYKKAHREWLECRDGKSPTLVTVAWKPEVVRVLPRGNWQSESGDIMEPATPHFLPQTPRAGTNRLTRLDLAKWLVAKDNPLTSRTVVNRFWRQFFGNALANPVDDLGAQGEPPSHPELLDWLSVEFREKGWDVKHLVRLMVTSATYRQSANLRPELREIDPNNRLLASQNPRRLEAEFVRDNALAIAGLLNRDLGGPSVHPYQPGGYYSNIQFPDRDYYASKDDRQYRRGLYSHWQRTFLQPMLANFDAPAREECTAIRNVSNTPQQALTLLNDPSFVEAARVWAVKLMASAKTDDERLELAFQSALSRGIKTREKESLKKFLAGQREHYAKDTEEPAKLMKAGLAPASDANEELAAWIQVARVVLNLHETVTRF
jgi:hypothetical protein